MKAENQAAAKHHLVLDIETAPDPMATRFLPPRERAKPMSTALHRLISVSMLTAHETSDGSWTVSSIKTTCTEPDGDEEVLLAAIDRQLAYLHAQDGILVTFNGRRHDLVSIRMRAAAHRAFDLPGIGMIPSLRHHDVMTDSFVGGGQWFKLRDVAAGLQIPASHEFGGQRGRAMSKASRKGEVDVAATFLVFLHDLAHDRNDAAPIVDGWRALGDYIRRLGSVSEHLAQFRRHPLGLGPDD